MTNLQKWDSESQISQIEPIGLQKIEWFHNKYGIISMRLTLSNGQISPILGNQHPDYSPKQHFEVQNGVKITKIIFTEYTYGYTNIELYDTKNNLLKQIGNV